MRADERHVHLAHEDVDVVARVSHERDSLLIARQVAPVLEQLRRVLAPVQIGRADRAAAVERLEVQPGRAHVAERLDVGVGSQRRPIRGQVVRDVLSEERPARFDERVVLAVAAVAEPAGRAQPVEERLVRVQWRQVEHAPVTAAGLDGRVDALGRQAVVA